ncbi:MAG TPA: hypothetical protein VFA50_22900 [Stellaceae bacterium]|nr:hypothetical protein [Stellaceae bacterium]
MTALTTRPDAGSAPAPGGASDRSTHFVFENKVFSLERAYFSLARDTKEPVYHVMLGTLTAALPLPTVRAEFNIDPDSPDGKLLDIIEKSLRYVREIRPNDSIPRELLDGSASWTVEERHRMIAQKRLAVQLSSWLSGEETVISDIDKLEQLADDPLTKQRVQGAFGEIAERIGIGRARQQEVIDKIDDFARELAYIEALREYYGKVKNVASQLARLSKVYKQDKSVTEDIVRILQLLRAPLAEFDANFGLIDAQTSEILNILTKYNAQVGFVREMRDDLHYRLSEWDALLEKWGARKIERSMEIEGLIKETYRFAAQNYPLTQNWRR